MNNGDINLQEIRRQIRFTRSWIDYFVDFAQDLILDQQLLTESYKLIFAIDFNEIRGFLHPFGLDELDPELDADLPFHQMIATAFLINQRRPYLHYGKPLLLRPYLEELMEHLDFLRRDFESLTFEKERISLELTRLRSDERIRALLEKQSPTKLDQNDVLILTDILRKEFGELTKLLYASELLNSGDGALLKFPIRSAFRLPAVEEMPIDHEEYRRVADVLCSSLWRHRGSRDPGRLPPDVSTKRDAEALAAVHMWNQRSEATGDRSVTYLLTSTKSIHSLLRTAARQADVSVSGYLTRGLLSGESSSLAGKRISTIRHPFEIGLLLAQWPSGIGDLSLARKRLIEVSQEAIARLPIIQNDLQRAESFFQFECCGRRAECRSLKLCQETEARFLRVGSELGSWRNLGMSIERTNLLPRQFNPRDIAGKVLSLIGNFDKQSMALFENRLLQMKESAGRNLIESLVEIELQTLEMAPMESQLFAEREGALKAFPYRIVFRSPALRRRLSRFDLAKREKGESRKAHAKRVTKALVGMREVSFRTGEEAEENQKLTACILLLLGHIEKMKRFVESVLKTGSIHDVSDWYYLHSLAGYFWVRSSERNRAVGEWAEYIKRIRIYRAATRDLRIQNLLGMAILGLARRQGDSELLTEAVGLFKDLLGEGAKRLDEFGVDFKYVASNNLAMALYDMYLINNDLGVLQAAYEIIDELPPEGIPEMQDTYGRIALTWGMMDLSSRLGVVRRGLGCLQEALATKGGWRVPMTDVEQGNLLKLINDVYKEVQGTENSDSTASIELRLSLEEILGMLNQGE